jgi:hypothetical protein
MSDALQLLGGLFEIGGLAFVALGIVETRRAFTDRPGIVQNVARRVAEFVARLTRKKRVHTLEVHDSLHMQSAASARLRVTYGFEGSLEERVERLQEIAQQHGNRLAEVTELVGSESEKLRAEIRSLQDALSESERELTERICGAASNGLTLESWGVFLFIIGVVLTTWGGVIA